MPEVRPFTGLVYDRAVAGPIESLTAPPYDVISPVDQERYHRASPFNVVRLILGRDDPADHARDDKYTRAAEHLRSWRAHGILVTTARPSMYPYELEFHLGGGTRRVRGVIAEVGLEGWDGSIVAHERTLPGPIEDRLRLLRAVQTNLSPIYTVLAGPSASPELSVFLDEAMAAPPADEVVDEAGTRHRVWVSSEGLDRVVAGLGGERLMIADGHHRYTVALAYQEEMRAERGPGPWDAVMMFVVDARAEDPPVLPIHRLILRGAPPSTDGQRVRDLAEVLATLKDDDLTYGTVDMDDGEVRHRIGSLDGSPPTVCVLHERILDPTPDLEVRFVPDAAAAEAAVLAGRAVAAYLLPPTKVDRVWKVVGSGGTLPQKSTYFWPKPRTGLVMRPLHP